MLTCSYLSIICNIVSFWNKRRFRNLIQVTRDTHLYLKDIEDREEGGTPAIVESIRAGMAFQLKQVRYG